jgi:hypothetical protein
MIPIFLHLYLENKMKTRQRKEGEEGLFSK